MGLGKNYLLEKQVGGIADGPRSGSGAAPAAAAAEPAKAKEIFDVKLKVVDAKAKIKVIKEIRTITGLGLKEVGLVACSNQLGRLTQ